MKEPRTYLVDVEGVGTFTFRRRTIGDLARIPNQAILILGGIPQHAWLLDQATMLAELEVLTVKSPDGWDMDDLDPVDEHDVARVRLVHGRLIEEEERFRGRSRADRGEDRAAA